MIKPKIPRGIIPSTAGIREKALLIGISCGLLYWLVESAIYAFAFGDGTFFQQMFLPNMEKLGIRAMVVSITIILSINAHIIISKLRNAEHTLRESEESYRSRIEDALDAICTINTEGIITTLNVAFETMTGWTRDEWLGKPFASIVHPDDLPHVLESFREAFEGGDLRTEEVRVKSKSGGYITVEIMGRPQVVDGQLIGLLGIARDINARRKAEEALRESEDKYSTLVELSADGIALMQDGRIIFSNNRVYEMFEVSESEIIDIGLEDLMSSDMVDMLAAMSESDMQTITSGILGTENGGFSAHTYQTPIKKRSGDIIWIELHVNPIIYKGKPAQLAFIRDISERKQAEEEIKRKSEELRLIGEELRELNIGLEEKVRERTAEVETLLRQKDDFVNQLGHDLKNPLTPLVTLLPIVERQEQDPKLKELVSVSARNANYMKELVIRTLALAKLNSPSTEFEIEHLYLLTEVDDIIADKRHILEENGINLRNQVVGTIIVEADPLRLRELLDNLIGNAIKFSIQGTMITIAAKKNARFVTVSVKDTGIGMTETQLEHIFEEFYKGDESRHKLDSSGLGLPICKRIVEKHGGEIWVESPGLGKGTTVFFTLKAGRRAKLKR